MDPTIYPNSPNSRLPDPLRHLALWVRNLVRFPGSRSRIRRDGRNGHSPGYVYEADGLATIFHSPFLSDSKWSHAYEEMARGWYVDNPGIDVRWRMWLLTSLARQARSLPGSFAEFGVYRAGCAWMILSTAGLDPSTRYFLFDTFEGIPAERLSESERQQGLGGRLGDTSVDYVAARLSRWNDQLVFCPGDVFDTLLRTEIDDLAFVHMDLNARAPTRMAFEYAYERLVPGGAIVFDDYGRSEYEDRLAIDEFSAGLPENVLALPTGQGLLVKLPG